MIDAKQTGLDPQTEDPRIVAALEEYLGALESNEAIDRDAFLAQYHEIAGELAACLDGLDFVHRVAPQLNDDDGKSAPVDGIAVARAEVAPIGDFRIIREIGRGGMGVVYEAEQMSLGRSVALKVLPYAAMLDPRQLQRFKNEAMAAAQLTHPNIVRVISVGNERGVHYYAMDYIDGRTLSDVIGELSRPGNADAARERLQQSFDALAPTLSDGAQPVPAAAAVDTAPVGRLSTLQSQQERGFYRTVAELGRQVAEALDHAHQQGVIHRDIKPSNLILDSTGKVWVTDFGLAHIESNPGLTMSGDLLGTLRYMSPEQAMAKRIVIDHRTDVYSLGVTLYELLTLRPVFPGNNRQELLRQIAFDEPPPPRRINAAIPPELDTIVLKAVAKDPRERYATAQDLADDLASYLEHRPIKARPPTLRDRARKWSQRHTAIVWSTAAVLLLTTIAMGASTVLIKSAFEREAESRRDAEMSEQKAQDAASAALNHAERATEEAERAEAAAERAWIAQQKEAAERHRAESALYVSDTRLAAANIDNAAYYSGYESLLKHYPADSQPDFRGWEWYYLLSQADQSLVSWQAGFTNVQDIDWSPDGEQIATVHWDGPGARTWNATTGELVESFDHGGTIKYGVSWSPDGKQLAWGCASGPTALRIWDSRSGEITEIPTDSGSHRVVKWSPDGERIAVSSLSQLTVFAKRGDDWNIAVSRAPGSNKFAWDPDGRRLLIGAQIIDATTLEPIHDIPVDGVSAGSWFPDDNLVALVVGRECVIFDIEREEERDRFDVGAVGDVRVSASGEVLATYGDDGFVKIWQIEDRKFVSVYQAHDGPVSSIAWSPDSKKLATCGVDGRIAIWPVSPRNENILRATTGAGGGVSWTKDGLIREQNSNVGLVEVEPRTGMIRREIELDISAQWSPVSDNVVRKTHENQITLCTLEDGRAIPRWTAQEPHAINYQSDGSAFAYAPAGFSIPVCRDLLTGVETPLGEKRIVVHRLTWSPDARLIAVVGGGLEGDDGNPMYAAWVHLFDAKTGTAIGRTRVGAERVMATWVSWSSDSSRIAVGTGLGLCEVLNVPTLRKVSSQRVHRRSVWKLSWSPDGRRVASGGPDRTVAIWDPESGEVLLRLPTEDTIHSLKWSPDGKILAARDVQRNFYLWDATQGYDRANAATFETGYHDRLEAQYQSMLWAQDFVDAQRIGIDLVNRRVENDVWTYYSLGLLSAESGKTSEYSEICERMLTRFLNSTIVAEIEFTAWTCALAPNAIDDYEPTIKLARHAADLDPEKQVLPALGAILMRAANYEEAEEQLEEALDASDDDRTSPSYVRYFLAMTEHYLGNKESAQEYLQLANESAEKELDGSPMWNRKLTLELLRSEAERLLGILEEGQGGG